MNTADKKVVLDAITEAAVCLAAIPDFMAGERITNALHQLQRAGNILEMKEGEDDFFEVSAVYNSGIETEDLVYVKTNEKGQALFRGLRGNYGYHTNADGLIYFTELYVRQMFKKL